MAFLQPDQTSNLPVLTPTELVDNINQTFEALYGQIVVVGELSNFRISKNRWVYFDLKDDTAKLACFCSVYQLPGPLEDGMMLQIVAELKLHPQFGFSATVKHMQPRGEGAIKKASDLLLAKLQSEGLFDEAKKRPLPFAPQNIGLISATNSAAYHDFWKLLNERWKGVHILAADSLVQGVSAPLQLTAAIQYLNQHHPELEALVVIRGGGSPDDLAAFNDERLVRAIAASRIPTLVAIGHEVDVCLAEMAADVRASTPSAAVQVLFPDAQYELKQLLFKASSLSTNLTNALEKAQQGAADQTLNLGQLINRLLDKAQQSVLSMEKIVEAFSPEAALQRGYSLAMVNGKIISSVHVLKVGQEMVVQLVDGKIYSNITKLDSHDK